MSVVKGIMPKTAESIIYLLSNNRPLFEELSSLLLSQNSDYAARIIETGALSTTEQNDLCTCDMVLCDMNVNAVFDTTVTSLLDRVPAMAPVIGLETADIPTTAIAKQPSYLRLAGITNLQKGWGPAWEKIIELRKAWKSPSMHSRIEDVSPSDVLQMIGISQWTAIVRIEGSQPGLHTGTIKGCISFSKGLPECAWSTHNTGIEAIWELISLEHGVLDVVRRIWPGCVRNVRGTIEEILITHALGIDESHPEADIAAQPQTEFIPIPETHWPAKGPRRTLDLFWNKYQETIGTFITETSAKQYPLRWMKWRELERLVTSEIQTQFLVLYGDSNFILQRINRFAPALKKDKIAGDTIPVIRTGKIGQSMLYIIGICNLDSGMRVLSRFPFVVHGDREGFQNRLSIALKTGVQNLLMVSSNPSQCLTYVSDTAADREWNACCIAETPETDGRAISGFFLAVNEALSLMAVEKNP